MSTFYFFLVWAASSFLASVRGQDGGVYFDMSEGNPGLEWPCPPGGPHPGGWTEEDAAQYEGGPLEGKVLKSESGVKSCLRTPDAFEVSEDFKFSISVYMPELVGIGQNSRTMQVWLIEEDDSDSYLILDTKGPSDAKWILSEVPVPTSGATYPKKYRVRDTEIQNNGSC